VLTATESEFASAPPQRLRLNGGLDLPRPRPAQPGAANQDAHVMFGPDVRLVRIYRRSARIAGIGAAAIGGIALVGWIAGIPLLTTLNPAWVAMKVNTAIAFLAAGIGLLLAVPTGDDRTARPIAVRVCGGLVAAIGLATLAEHVFGLDLGIDQWLLVEPAGAIGTVVPGRMAQLTATNFALFGSALLAHSTRRGGFIATVLTLVILGISVLVLTSYFLDAAALYKFSRTTVVAFPTAMAFLLLSTGLLAAQLPSQETRYRPYLKIAPYILAVLGVEAVTVVCFPLSLRENVNKTTVALALLLVVQFAATLGGRWPGLLASTLAALTFDYFFLPPMYTFIIGSAQDWLALGAFFVTAVTVGELSGLARRRAEAAEAGRRIARQANAYNRGLIEASLDPLVTIGRDGRITDANAATEAISGRSRDELVGTDFADIFTDPAHARAGYERAFRDGSARDYPLDVRRRDGAGIPVLYNASVYRDETGEVAGVFAAARDVSGIERAEREIRRFASFPRLSPVPIVEFDPTPQARYMNSAMQTMLAKCGIDDPCRLIPARWISRLARGEIAEAADAEELEIAGRTFDERIHFSPEFQSLRMWVTDITERKQNEQTLARLNRTLRTLSSANQMLVRAKSEAELLREMCKVLVEVGGYRMVWIGLAEHDAAKSVRVAAVAGYDDGYTSQARISWADDERGRGPTGTAIRLGEPQVNLNFATDPRMGPWRAEAVRRGYTSSAALPLKDASGVIGALTVYSGEAEVIGRGELELFVELANDLAYGIASLRAGGEREAAVRRLDESLEDTVGAIASTIELRDPYTAGHQRRVAKLAAAIARQMGLSDDRTRGIFFAGLIHDVGKINVPAEILSKPGRLSALEMQLIQTHAQAGYDIIKGVEFPWPIAETVLQHHERLDGSGYPRGLGAADIILEARILAIADVTEAITAHRPYRPAKGPDAALAELEAGRGRLYDPAAVDACIDLFRNKGFAF
jgi:PAS domain S-box-containing protein